jgi:hypothetical protein
MCGGNAGGNQDRENTRAYYPETILRVEMSNADEKKQITLLREITERKGPGKA